MFYLFHALLPDRTRETNQIMLQTLVSVLNQRGLIFSPLQFMLDFETAMISSITVIFSSAVIEGCYFHFTQAIWRNVLRIGLSSFYENSNVLLVIKGLMALPLIPLDKISDGMGYIESIIPPTDHPSRPFLDHLLIYFNRIWLRGQFHPSMWNCHRNFNIRTMNHSEGWHHRLNDRVKRKHPDIYVLIAHLKIEKRTDKNRLLLYDNGHRVPQPEKKYRDLNRRIVQYTQEFEAERWSLYSFLEHSSCCVHNPTISFSQADQ